MKPDTTPSARKKFTHAVWTYYRTHGRHDLPWRKTRDPYKILVSEIMLQQTQVSRVIPKYKEFLAEFPTLTTLAKAPTEKLLAIWQGLGYNRRALALREAARTIVRDHGGKFPRHYDTLITLPSVGPATAADLLAFAWNIPAPTIETNVRTVYIHHFFPDKKAKNGPVTKQKGSCKIHDKDLWPVVRETFDIARPREWIWALMDYGTMLKKVHGNTGGRRSAHHTKQSKFAGSNRELRSQMLKTLLKGPASEVGLLRKIKLMRNNVANVADEQLRKNIRKNLHDLKKEGFIVQKGTTIRIAELLI